MKTSVVLSLLTILFLMMFLEVHSMDRAGPSSRSPGDSGDSASGLTFEQVRHDMKYLYHKLKWQTQVLNDPRLNKGDPHVIQDWSSRMKKTRQEIIKLRPKLRKILGFEHLSDSGNRHSIVVAEIERLQEKVKINDAVLRELEKEDVPVKAYLARSREHEQDKKNLAELNRTKSWLVEEKNMYEKPERGTNDIVPRGTEIV